MIAHRRHRRWFFTMAAFAAGLALAPAPALAQPDSEASLKAEAKARLETIEKRLDAWDVEAAAAEAQALSELIPGEVEALLYYQGRIAFEQGRYKEAIELLQRAGIADKPDSYLRLATETEKITRDYQKAESEHFIFLYPKGKDEVLAPFALEALESIRQAMLEDLGYAPPGKVRVEVVANARELAKVSTLTAEQIRKTGTIAICKFNKLMITSPKAVVRGYDWLDTLAHEYIHLVVSRKSDNSVPIWLHEGLAKYLESRWRGGPGLALAPSQLALLGHRVKQDKLIPFEKMHPSIALLPTAEDASTAFSEVFFAIDLIHKQHGTAGLRTLIDALRAGASDRAAVEKATGKSFPAFEKAWLSYVKRQPFPKELLPMIADEVKLKEDLPGAKKDTGAKGREISYGEFAIVTETEARKFAHLGELMRERRRAKAAAIEFAKAHKIVGDKYHSVSDKYALSLLEIGEVEKAEQVLLGSLRVHPGVPATQVHLGRIYVARKEWEKARRAYLEALATDPFDPEIHISLVGVARSLNRSDEATRAMKHSEILTGLPAAEIEPLVKQVLARSDRKLATSGVDTEPEPEPASAGSPPGQGPHGATGSGGNTVEPAQPVTGGPAGPTERFMDPDGRQIVIGPDGKPLADDGANGKRQRVNPDRFILEERRPQQGARGKAAATAAEAAYLVGRAREENGDIAGAIQSYERAIKTAPLGSEWRIKARERLDALNGRGGERR